MMRIDRVILMITICAITVVSCSKPNNQQPVEPIVPPVVLPEPPVEVKQSNLFYIDYCSDYKGNDRFFDKYSKDDVVSHLTTKVGKKAVTCIFDDTGFVIGEKSPLVEIAYKSGMAPYFVQYEKTGERLTTGAGMFTPFAVKEFNSFVEYGIYASGFNMKVALSRYIDMSVFATSLSSIKQLKNLIDAGYDLFEKDAIAVILVPTAEASSMMKCAETSGFEIRAYLHEVKNGDSSLIVLMPGNYVCRGVETLKTSFPCDRISIEKFKW